MKKQYEEKFLQKATKSFLERNGISVVHFSHCINVETSKVRRWLIGERKFTEDEIGRTWQFLDGIYFRSLDECLNEMYTNIETQEEEAAER